MLVKTSMLIEHQIHEPLLAERIRIRAPVMIFTIGITTVQWMMNVMIDAAHVKS